MMKRLAALVALVALGIALGACGNAPDYTVRQAMIDMPAFEPGGIFYQTGWDKCVAEHLFRSLKPAQVKAAIQGADLGYLPPGMVDAEYACYTTQPTSPQRDSGVVPSSASLDHPSKGTISHLTTTP